jgi:hypothetical protein
VPTRRSCRLTGDSAGRPGRPRHIVLLAGLLALAVRTAWSQPVSPEYRVKAAFVSSFARFVEWPAAAVRERPALDLCVLHPSPFGRVLQELADGETVRGRPLAVRQVRADAAATCHLLFVPADAGGRRQLLQRLAREPVLTVGDAPDFLDDGGTIAFRVVDNRVRFDINSAAAEAAGLRISAQLLRLAERGRRGGE